MSDNLPLTLEDNLGKGNTGLSLAELNFACILCDISSIDNALPQVRDITPLTPDQIEIRLTMSPEILGSFGNILKALTTLFRHMKTREMHALALKEARAPERKAKSKRKSDRMQALCIKEYTKALSAGLKPNQAISEANKRLKAKGHKWASYFIVHSVVSKHGLLKETETKKDEKT